MGVVNKIQTFLKKSPSDLRNRILFLIAGLIISNIIVWILVFYYSHFYPILLGLATIAYGFGLRHAVDADHIAAIDNTTRKLVQEGKQPTAIGLFFSLGHSTIVIVLSAMVAFSAGFVNEHLPQYKAIGSLIGTTVSALFLILIGILNLMVFIDVLKIWRHVTKKGRFNEDHVDHHLHDRGLLARLFKPLIKAVSKSQNMYLVGLLFGLGFDTATEVGLLSISAASISKGIPPICIMLLPCAFTVGMALIDTIDGILMLGAYGWANIKPIRKLYYNLNITFISVVIALFIGSVEALQVISKQTGMDGGIFAVANSIQFDWLGYFIIGIFIISWIISVFIYKYRRYDLLDLDHH
jgi:high-affinity nickel-transport protein